MIKANNLKFEYFKRDKDGNVSEVVNAIDTLNLDIKQGDYIAIMGVNGSGKSTLAKLLNRILVGSEGSLYICNKDAFNINNQQFIRKNIGVIFQNPENQIIATTVEDEVAFGPENLCYETELLWENVLGAIDSVGLTAYRNYFTSDLSGGQLQKVALAGVLAMEPKCIILDESTSMLSETDRINTLAMLKLLNEKLNITIINITHFSNEALVAKKLYIMESGRVTFMGKPSDVFLDSDLRDKCIVSEPTIFAIADALNKNGIIRSNNYFDIDDLCKQIVVESFIEANKFQNPKKFIEPIIKFYEENINSNINHTQNIDNKLKNSIIMNNVSFKYDNQLNKEFQNDFNISDVSLSIGKNEFVVVTGDSGAGKTTLMKMINGIIKPNSGQVYLDGLDVFESKKSLTEVRKKVVFGFQFPEQQMFAKNVIQDVVFGPRNLGLSDVEASKRAYEAIEAVGLPDNIYDTSIKKLSGGEKRRVALAGLLAMKPEFLILDEPTANLDSVGKKNLLELLKAVQVVTGMTIIVISHDIDACAEVATRYIRMNKGKIEIDASIEIGILKSFNNSANMNHLPDITKLLVMLRKRGMPVRIDICKLEEGIEEIVNVCRNNK